MKKKRKMHLVIKQKLMALLIMMLFIPLVHAQQLSVSGHVTDDRKEPLPGVTVTIKGTSTGTITDIKGNFNLKANIGDVLLVSFIGMVSQEVTVASNEALKIVLPYDVVSLNEVVAVGYGTMKKSDLTGSVSSVSAAQLVESGAPTLEQALIGRAAGVVIETGDNSPGGATSIRIRGANSISGSSEPLFVIDGVPVMNNSDSGGNEQAQALSPIAGLSPNDIESVDILKDASATAIYGAQGANGVIMITTKKGKSGSLNISVNTSGGVQFADTDVYDMMDSYEFANFKNGYHFRYPQKSLMTEEDIQNTGYGKYWDTSAFKDTTTTDWMDAVTRQGVVQDYHVGINGGANGNNFNVGMGYYNNKGILQNTEMDRYTLNFSLRTDAKKRVQFGINMFGSYLVNNGMLTSNASSGDQNAGILLQALRYSPLNPLTDEDGNYVLDDEENESSAFSPYLTATGVDMNTKSTYFNVNAFVKINIGKGLDVKASAGGNMNDMKISNFFPSTTSWGLSTQGKSFIRNRTTTKWVSDLLLTYNKTFNGKHKLNALVGTTANQFDSYSLTTINQNYSIENLGNDAIQIGMDPTKPSSYADGWTLMSYLGRAFYSFDDKYSLTASVRADGSSRVAYNNRWGYFPSAAASWRISEEGFMESAEAVSNLKVRLGYGVTGNQNIPAYQPYDTYSLNDAVIGGNLTPSSSIQQLPNNDLKWETTEAYNVGIDFGFFNNRISGSVDVYQKNTKDLLLNAIVPSTAGVQGGTMYKNMGKMENKGVELALNTVNIDKKVKWTSTFTIAMNRNMVTDLGDNDTIQVAGTRGPNQTMLIEGQPIGIWWGWESAGIWQQDDFTYSFGHAEGPQGIDGNPLAPGWHLNADENGEYPAFRSGDQPGKRRFRDLDGDGDIDADDRTIVGVSQPDFTGSFSNSIMYKNFDMNFLLEFSYGKEIFHGTKWHLVQPNTSFHNKLNADYWRATEYEIIFDENNRPIRENKDVVLVEGNPSNENIYIGTGDHTENLNDTYIEDGSYLRLKSLTLGYSLPSKITRKYGINKMRFYVSGTNLWTLTGYTGYDPAVNTSSLNGLRPGYDYSAYPLTKTITFGLNLNF
ncbi:TonB-dependent receptor [Labilibacter sediminis]|nr:TonB-dependent receptor [Labilibacter sediminis]